MRRRLRRRTIIIRICSLALPASCRRVARVLPANEASNSGPTLSVGLAVISLRCCAVLCCAVLVASVILFTNRARVLFLARHTKSAHCSIDLLQCALFCVTLSTVILSLAVRVNLMVCVLTKPQVVHDHSFQPTKIWTRRFWECERGVTGWLESWRCLPPPWAWA